MLKANCEISRLSIVGWRHSDWPICYMFTNNMNKPSLLKTITTIHVCQTMMESCLLTLSPTTTKGQLTAYPYGQGPSGMPWSQRAETTMLFICQQSLLSGYGWKLVPVREGPERIPGQAHSMKEDRLEMEATMAHNIHQEDVRREGSPIPQHAQGQEKQHTSADIQGLPADHPAHT